MLNMNIDTSTNSIPYLLYMQEQENNSNDDSGNDKVNTSWNQNTRPNAQSDD